MVEEGKLLDAAEYCRSHLPEQQLFELLRQLLDPKDLSPAEVHKIIADLRFPAIVTTNYDRLLESAIAAVPPNRTPPAPTHLDVASPASPTPTTPTVAAGTLRRTEPVGVGSPTLALELTDGEIVASWRHGQNRVDIRGPLPDIGEVGDVMTRLVNPEASRREGWQVEARRLASCVPIDVRRALETTENQQESILLDLRGGPSFFPGSCFGTMKDRSAFRGHSCVCQPVCHPTPVGFPRWRDR